VTVAHHARDDQASEHGVQFSGSTVVEMRTQPARAVQRVGSRWIAVGRGILALTFLAGASYSVLVTLRAPVIELQGLIALSPLPLIRLIATRVAIPHATLFTVMVVLFEVSVGLSMLAPLFVRRVAYLGALAFFVVLIPLVSWYGLTNLVWAVPVVGLLRHDRADRRVAA
jgi:hypothetical protein